MPHAKAKRIIIEGRGRHFDPTIVDLFLEVEGQFVNVAEASHQEAATLSSIANLCEQVANIRNDRETTPELTPA